MVERRLHQRILQRILSFARTSTGPDKWTKSSSERVQKRHEGSHVGGAELHEQVPRSLSLAIMCEDRIFDLGGARVVQKPRACAQAPERRGAHLAPLRLALFDPVAQAPHVMQEEIGEGVEDDLIQRGNGAGAGLQRWVMADGAADLMEDRFAGLYRGRDRTARRRAQEGHEVGEGLDAWAIVLGIRHRVAGRQQRGIALGRVLGGNKGFVIPISLR